MKWIIKKENFDLDGMMSLIQEEGIKTNIVQWQYALALGNMWHDYMRYLNVPNEFNANQTADFLKKDKDNFVLLAFSSNRIDGNSVSCADGKKYLIDENSSIATLLNDQCQLVFQIQYQDDRCVIQTAILDTVNLYYDEGVSICESFEPMTLMLNNYIKALTWDDMSAKYPMYRDEMSEDVERQFVEDSFRLYEQEGFANAFWSQGGDFIERHGQSFEIVERASSEHDCDLEVLPMWRIKFSDGETLTAYPDEIIPSEMKANGCKLNVYSKKEEAR